MKKIYYLIILALILSLILTGCSLLSNVGQVPATEQSGIAYLTKGSEAFPDEIPLIAGQDNEVGTVSVWNDGVELHITYNTTGGWVMTETHLAVVKEIGDFPTNKAGNPKVGLFPYGVENIFQNTWEEIIDLSAIPAEAGQDLFIAAHAVVADTNITKEEVVVSRPGIDAYGPLDEYADLGDSLWGSSKLAVPTYQHPAWESVSSQMPDATWISTAYFTEEPVANNSWRWFHDEITLPEKGYYIAGSVFLATSDNAEEVYFNGELVGSDGEVQGPFSDNHEWATVLPYSIIPQPGLNTLDFIVRNYAGSTLPTDNPTGLIYKVSVTYYPEESAWGAGDRFVLEGNWATYFEYLVEPQYEFVETVDVPSEYIDGIDSTIPLTLGQEYELRASGTYRFANWGEYGIADAEWSYRNASHVPLGEDAGWIQGEGYFTSPCGLDVQVDNTCVHWGDLDEPNHKYEIIYSGTGSIVHFHIYDSEYSDNSGSIDVEIWKKNY